ncbi:MAG TPA: hypothetical protein VEW65_07990 [Chryseolinea sp.]|nr:hypothetical protein [Chryseolinea sp.]
MKDDICESCETNRASITEEIEVGPPYKLCEDCHHRLVNLALRPLEYFNLTARHGHSYLLHDDFYDNGNGEATAPEIDVVNPEGFPFPTLEHVKHDTNRLIDFAIVQFITDDSVFDVIMTHDKTAVLHVLNKRLMDNEGLKYKLLEVAANGLGSFAESWVREIWKRRTTENLSIYAEALTKCLPFQEAFQELTTELEKEDNKQLGFKIEILIYFERQETLDWIEKIKDRIINVSDSWGNLTAASKFDWKRAQRWINEGRPLSLIALDALMYCTTIGERQNQILWFRKHPPKLVDAAKPEIIASVVNDYMKKDTVPRVKNVGNRIIKNLFEIVE